MNRNKWILPYLKQYRGLLFLSILLGSLTILFGGALMFTSGYLISKSATMPESILMVYVPIVGVRTFGIGRAVLSYLERLVGHQFVLKILSQMRVRLYKIIEPQALFITSRFRTGDILGVLADDIEHLQEFYLKTLFPAITSLVVYSVIIIGAGLFSVPFAILLACLIGLILFVGPFVSFFYVRGKNEKLKHGRNQLYQQFTEAVFGISDWIFSGHTKAFIHRYELQEQKLLKVETQKQSFVNYRDIVNQLILGSIVIVAIYWASDLTASGEIPPTLIAAFALVLLSLLESFLPIAEGISETTSYQESLKRLDSLQIYSESKQETLAIDISNSQILIEINNVSLGYSDKLLLHDFILKIEQGERIAIIGRSGAGKSTLLKLIKGVLAPVSGAVKLNGIDAHKREPSISKIMGVLNQKPYLFNTSVLNNIRLGNPEASDVEVHEVAKMVQLDEMIRELPQGYETNMQETGQRFSGGERQRIALARILLQKTPVVILDEPTVGLDPITEVKLLRTIFDNLKGKTIIWVTHHLIGVEKMDRILFLENGKIAMEGSHSQLLENEERYRRLYKLDCPFKKV
ncbi:thiol reductant ABC exporter subunit CydC [Bacillus sp. EB106-08-02-XG196]|jgi:ATP-binding cassette, subfamily C, bacterial CydC|uniref:thiol reductant ABC exporter subunit CydC n=1 Tax=Bacillus sp. EB106-08-02-XG196 TaxID=2737049 RepID=UPI0015C436AA|nr:thiol reductant ABC exporter subunit CydC [Bacillus sp. EB106-08-02-XG196]NWQ42219.1 thiol reductant ABC exporter subunit CydC [Bacillus sp. EB106-08-02-XG196]